MPRIVPRPGSTAPLRAALAALLIAGVAAAGVLVAQPATAASGAVARVLVQRDDPTATDPVSVQVAAFGADDSPVPFTGRLTLAVGRTTSIVTVSGDGAATVDVPTRALTGGLAVLTAVIRGTTGRPVTVRRTQFAEIVPSLQVAGFGCTAVGPGGGTIRFAVTRMAGEVIRTPNSRFVPLLPYVAPSGRRSLMIDDDWRPLSTSGTVAVLSGTRTVATLRLGKQVRRLVFGAPWKGGVAPGVYAAKLTLVDAVGRVSTAVTPVTVVRTGTLPCGV